MLASTSSVFPCVRIVYVPSWSAWMESGVELFRKTFGRSKVSQQQSSLRASPPMDDDLVVGLDAEWVGKNPIAVLQICGRGVCFVLHVTHLGPDVDGHADGAARVARGIPSEVKELLIDPSIVKAGVNIQGDATRLRREFGIECQTLLSLDHMSHAIVKAEVEAERSTLPSSTPPNETEGHSEQRSDRDAGLRRKFGLASLAEEFLNVTLGKDKDITVSDWDAAMLSAQQIAYAADDAIASGELASVLFERWCRGANRHHLEPPMTLRDWVITHGPHAYQLFRQWHRDLSRRENEIGKHKAPDMDRCCASKSGSSSDPYNVEGLVARLSLPAVPVAPHHPNASVDVLDVDGNRLFLCDLKKAEWYIKRKLASVVSWREKDGREMKQPAVIRLEFTPKMKTKLCLNHQLGHCPVGSMCPFAHGSSELQLQGVATTSETEALACEVANGSAEGDGVEFRPSTGIRTPDGSCAICLSPTNTIKHAVVPPSLRRWLPVPYRYTVNEDYLWVCFQCNPRVRLVYDQLLKSHYAEAEKRLGEDDRVNIHRVKRVVGYAQMLLPRSRSTSQAPIDRDEVGETVEGSDSEFVLNADEPREEGAEEKKPAGRRKRLDQDAPSADTEHKIPEARLEEMRAYVEANWKDTKLHEIIPELRNSNSSVPVDAALLQRISRVVPGEVRARATMRALVGDDTAKAHDFVSRWRQIFEQTFRPQLIPWQRNKTEEKGEMAPDAAAGNTNVSASAV